jgi:hypothetical protein
VESDDSYLCYKPGFTINSSEAPVTLDFAGTLGTDTPGAVQVNIESSASTPNLALTVSFFNYNTSTWDIVGTDSQTFNVDTVRTFDGVPADHVQPGTGQVKARYEVRKAGFTLQFPWTDCIDQVSFSGGTPSPGVNTYISRDYDVSAFDNNTLQISFASSFRVENQQLGVAEISFDNGATWIRLLELDNNDGANDTQFEDFYVFRAGVDFTAVDSDSMILRFGYLDAGNNWWFAVDDVMVEAVRQ